jgi:subtilisin
MADLRVSTTVEDLLVAALGRGATTFETGRFIVTFREGAADAGIQMLRSQSGLRMSSARDFSEQAVAFDQLGDAEALVLPEIGVALVGGEAYQARSAGLAALSNPLSPVASVDPEHFMFALGLSPSEYLRGFRDATDAISRGLIGAPATEEERIAPEVLGVTWGLAACKVPPSAFSGSGIKVGMLDTGMDLGHPEFAGRSFTTNTFVGQPVQDLNGHGTHTTGTACGPKTPASAIPRYGIGFSTLINSGKVLTNSGSGTQAAVLAGMNWAIAQRCQVISMSLGAQIPVQPSYTAAGNAALAAGCLIIAAAGNSAAATGAPANSPSIMSVAAVDESCNRLRFPISGRSK